MLFKNNKAKAKCSCYQSLCFKIFSFVNKDSFTVKVLSKLVFYSDCQTRQRILFPVTPGTSTLLNTQQDFLINCHYSRGHGSSTVTRTEHMHRPVSNTVSTPAHESFHKRCNKKQVAHKFINTPVVKTIEWIQGDVSSTLLYSEPSCYHGVVALRRQASTSVEWTNVASCAERLKCDAFNDVSVRAFASLLCLMHTCILLLSHTLLYI